MRNDSGRELWGWQSNRTTESAWETAKPVLTGLLSSWLRQRLGLP
jgi:hypothetical protein